MSKALSGTISYTAADNHLDGNFRNDKGKEYRVSGDLHPALNVDWSSNEAIINYDTASQISGTQPIASGTVGPQDFALHLQNKAKFSGTLVEGLDQEYTVDGGSVTFSSQPTG